MVFNGSFTRLELAKTYEGLSVIVHIVNDGNGLDVWCVGGWHACNMYGVLA